jgi:proteic killer suppression protein
VPLILSREGYGAIRDRVGGDCVPHLRVVPTRVDAPLSLHRTTYYIFAVIRSWGNAATCKVFEGERPRQFRGMDYEAAVVLLDALNVAKALTDLSPLNRVGLHKLKGDRRGQWAMTVNGRWRICFSFHDGHAQDVEIVDYHRG